MNNQEMRTKVETVLDNLLSWEITRSVALEFIVDAAEDYGDYLYDVFTGEEQLNQDNDYRLDD